MTKTSFKALALLGIVFLIISCNQVECKSTNLIFNKYQPNSNEYNKELAKQLKITDNSKLIYKFQRYENNNGKDYIYITIQGDSLCAESAIRVLNWDDTLLAIKETKGNGYSGAVLKNLKIESMQEGAKTEFVYKAEDVSFPSCHASTIVETPEGMISAWFGGTEERAPDVCIYIETLKTEGRLRTTLEVWTNDKNIDIIR
jgi:hypothetical protein